MRSTTARRACALVLLAASAGASADRNTEDDDSRYAGVWPVEERFRRIATVPNYINNEDPAAGTVAEIIAATKNGKLLVYTDSPGGQIGFIFIGNPYHPMPFGTLAMGGQPTSIDVLGNDFALVAVDTSESFTSPSGHLAVVDLDTRTIVRTLDLGGQPDSLKIAPSRKYAAIAIENERDEEVEVDGVEGGLPQAPAGFLAIVDIGKDPADWTVRTVDLTGLAGYAPDDPEPEFVDVDSRDRAVVTLQENNHIAIVDLRTGAITADFPAGTVDLDGIDTAEENLISLTGSLAGVAREPDAVAWVRIGKGRNGIATANEGDLFGGSRGFSIFDANGDVIYDSGAELEALAVSHGHYPEGRSENKGTEPEAVEYGRFGRHGYLFVASERGSFVAVYELGWNGEPRFVQLLPAPAGPEGVLAIPQRDLLIVSGEVDTPVEEDDGDPLGLRSTVMIYKLVPNRATYPQILSGPGASGAPIGWSALSGMVAAPGRRNEVLAVWDSYFAAGRIFTIDVSRKPAVVTGALEITGASVELDAEGIAAAPDGTYWIASEGNASDSRPNVLLQVDASGAVIAEAGLPAEILACRAASANDSTLGSGFEGVAVLRTLGGYKLVVAQQRGWDYTTPECEALDDDPDDVNPAEPAFTRIWIYDPADSSWDYVAYELEPLGPDASWVGLSEITAVRDGSFIVIERDNRGGDFADLKTLVRARVRDAYDGLVSRSDKASFDLVPALLETNGWITDKPEGVAVMRDGRTFVVTDNDGVDGWSGETWFLRLGNVKHLFRRR